ncbi:BREX-1 system phosphatase PglZ type A [Winogradskyella sp. UBA3174]|uniref:BREX-1 system phosphatase PglZ type A n=1 Tax=Winogradskyella sp. UBA3174 TaxID=1947785 RepID=UPI0025D11A93|nr:BREX-1 system phosphatase PglZ type A [Winogradskyella sp. UBA3174]|tara:strand:- start:116645 stop:119200 length:2556 start_codon:yes stop_codon:yes gene_type:complete
MIEKIQNILKQQKRNIIFYFDEDGSFKEELTAIENSGIKVVEVSDNYFELKYKLEFEWTKELVFLYHPFAKPLPSKIKKYPFLGLLKANTELRLDAASEFLSDYKLNEIHLPLVKHYIKQLKLKSNQKKLAKILDPDHFSADSLKLGLIAITLNYHSVTDKNSCMSRLLEIATDENKLDKTIKNLKELELDEVVLMWFNNLLDTKYRQLNYETLTEIANKLKYNVLVGFISKPLSSDSYSKLKLERTADINKVQSFFQDWQTDPNSKVAIDEVFNMLARDIKTSNLLDWYSIEQEYGYYSEAMLNAIINGLYDTVLNQSIETKDKSIKWKRSDILEDRLKSQVVFIYHVASMLEVLNAFKSFKFNTPDDYIDTYKNELYKVDLHYRKAVLAFDSVRDKLFEFEDKAIPLFNEINGKYDRFLIELNTEWQKILQENNFNFHNIKTNKQFDFHKNYVQDFNSKIVVIISDAFRYELGYELYDELMADSKNLVEIEPYLASLPSYTNLGMSNLLPNKGITVEKGDKDLVFKIDGKSTVSTNRAKILQNSEPKSACLDYSRAMKFSRDEGRDFFRDNRVLYIYHDWMDAIGDKKRTEHETFNASTKTIEDIKDLIMKIYGWNVYNVLVTSDHGFLYNNTTLTESSREHLPKPKGYSRDHSRFVVADDFESKLDGYGLEMKNTTNIDTDLKIAIPRAINRYRKQGNIGVQFVHGGASLQELLVPVVKFFKDTKKEKSDLVSFKRIDQNDRISSGSIKVTLLQDQPVDNELKSAEVLFALYSEKGDLYSKEVEVHFNSTSGNPKERIFEIILSLNTLGSNASFCYLKAYHKDDKSRLNPLGTNDLIKVNTLMEKDEF